MKIGHENGFDWVWVLDQDGAASDLCLTELLKRAEDGDILCPKKVGIDNPSVVYTRKRLKKNFFGHLRPVRLSADMSQIDAFGTHGVLISKKVMDSIGYYNACNFFIGYEDYDYARRALQAKFAIIAVDEAVVRHPDLAPTPLSPRGKRKPVDIHRFRPDLLGNVTNPGRGGHCCNKLAICGRTCVLALHAVRQIRVDKKRNTREKNAGCIREVPHVEREKRVALRVR
jgi:hypothetical protein